MRILICGASIAGPAAAFWLARAGHEVTVCERAPGLRRGGYAVDVRGVALEVVRRMGLYELLRALQTDTESNSLVDGSGRRFGRLPRGFGVVDDNDLELLRGDFASVLFQATRDETTYRFGTTIAALQDHGSEVEVELSSGEVGRYDLVVGADGVHSRVRALTFGAESRFVLDLGSAMAIGTVPNSVGLVREQLTCHDVRRIATAKSDRGGTLKVCFFYPMQREAFDPEDAAAQRRQVVEAFADSGWRWPELAASAARSEDFYADLTCQIRMERRTRGRVALVGDAGYCASPLAGQGTSLALVGAYLLARELGSGLDVTTALARYDDAVGQFATKNQDLARKLAGGFMPSSRLERGVRNAVLRALPYLPGTGYLMSLAMRGLRDAAQGLTLAADDGAAAT